MPLKFAKGPTRSTLKRRAKRDQAAAIRAVRAYVFEREDGVCRCCGWRPARSMHEVRFRSHGGKVSRANSIAVCGDGVRGCHGLLQRHEIRARFDRQRSADGWMAFRPMTERAAQQMGWYGLMDATERVSDARTGQPRSSEPLPRRLTVIERLIDKATGYKPQL